YPLIPVGDPEQLAHFLGCPSLEIAQDEHAALSLRQDGQPFIDACAQLPAEDHLFRTCAVRAGPGIPMVGGDRLRVRLRCIVAVGVARGITEGYGACLPPRLCARAIQQNAEEPRLERGIAPEPVDASDDGDPGVLDHLFGACAAPYVAHGE